jgi:hypothetical protein
MSHIANILHILLKNIYILCVGIKFAYVGQNIKKERRS